jgi:AcrR family transcriptional regulator
MARPPGHGPGFETRRLEVIHTAAKLFARRGYAATGIAELSRETGLTKGPLYYYIGSKEALLVEIQNSVLVPLIAAARRIQAIDEHPILRLRLLSETLLDVVAERLEYIWVVEHDLRLLTGEARAHLLSTRRELEAVVTSLLREAMDRGDLRRIDERLAMLQFFNLHNYTYNWFRPDTQWSPAELSREFCATLFGGLGTRQGPHADLEAQVEEFRLRYEGPSLRGLTLPDTAPADLA